MVIIVVMKSPELDSRYDKVIFSKLELGGHHVVVFLQLQNWVIVLANHTAYLKSDDRCGYWDGF